MAELTEMNHQTRNENQALDQQIVAVQQLKTLIEMRVQAGNLTPEKRAEYNKVYQSVSSQIKVLQTQKRLNEVTSLLAEISTPVQYSHSVQTITTNASSPFHPIQRTASSNIMLPRQPNPNIRMNLYPGSFQVLATQGNLNVLDAAKVHHTIQPPNAPYLAMSTVNPRNVGRILLENPTSGEIPNTHTHSSVEYTMNSGRLVTENCQEVHQSGYSEKESKNPDIKKLIKKIVAASSKGKLRGSLPPELLENVNNNDDRNNSDDFNLQSSPDGNTDITYGRRQSSQPGRSHEKYDYNGREAQGHWPRKDSELLDPESRSNDVQRKKYRDRSPGGYGDRGQTIKAGRISEKSPVRDCDKQRDRQTPHGNDLERAARRRSHSASGESISERGDRDSGQLTKKDIERTSQPWNISKDMQSPKKKETYYCQVCGRPFGTLKGFKDHCMSRGHHMKYNYKKIGKKIPITRRDRVIVEGYLNDHTMKWTCCICEVRFDEFKNLSHHFVTAEHKDKRIRMMKETGITLDGIHGNHGHSSKAKHEMKIYSVQERLKLQVSAVNHGGFYCLICMLSVDPTIQRAQHLASKSHHHALGYLRRVAKLKNLIADLSKEKNQSAMKLAGVIRDKMKSGENESEKLYCSLCETKHSNKQDLEEHCSSYAPQHSGIYHMLEVIVKIVEALEKSENKHIMNAIKDHEEYTSYVSSDRNHWLCLLCEETHQNETRYERHRNQPKHVFRKFCYQETYSALQSFKKKNNPADVKSNSGSSQLAKKAVPAPETDSSHAASKDSKPTIPVISECTRKNPVTPDSSQKDPVKPDSSKKNPSDSEKRIGNEKAKTELRPSSSEMPKTISETETTSLPVSDRNRQTESTTMSGDKTLPRKN
ncbi:uncharacterized protein [Ptychodera flava]|uniref:uncharacterized protein n=1 Tax=Ptychodera flava TaxID=63121 RepID=UPI00396A7FC1